MSLPLLLLLEAGLRHPASSWTYYIAWNDLELLTSCLHSHGLGLPVYTSPLSPALLFSNTKAYFPYAIWVRSSTPESTGFPTKPHCNYTAATGWTPGLFPPCSLLNQKTSRPGLLLWGMKTGFQDLQKRMTLDLWRLSRKISQQKQSPKKRSDWCAVLWNFYN